MRRARVTSLYELDVVADALHVAFDLLVTVTRRYILHPIPLPTEFAPDDLRLPLDVPRNIRTKAHRAVADCAQLLQWRIRVGLQIPRVCHSSQPHEHVVRGDAEIHGSVEALFINLLV